MEERVQRIESTLDGYEQRVADIGAQKVAETAQKVAEVSDKANKVFASLERNERHLESLEGRIPWTTVGKVPLLCYRCSPRSCSWVASCGAL